MSEIGNLLFKCSVGQLGGSIENCIVVAHDNGNVATATNAAEELARLRADIDHLRKLMLKEPTIIESFPMNFPKNMQPLDETEKG